MHIFVPKVCHICVSASDFVGTLAICLFHNPYVPIGHVDRRGRSREQIVCEDSTRTHRELFPPWDDRASNERHNVEQNLACLQKSCLSTSPAKLHTA